MAVEPLRPRRLPSPGTIVGWAIAALVLVSVSAITAWQIGRAPASNPGPARPGPSSPASSAAAAAPVLTAPTPSNRAPSPSNPVPAGPGRSAKKA